jgi:KUP system potassium uptake protein
MEEPDVPLALSSAGDRVLPFDLGSTTFFVGLETLLSTRREGMPRWRERLFAVMSRNAARATSFFRIPPERVVELGMQIEL